MRSIYLAQALKYMLTYTQSSVWKSRTCLVYLGVCKDIVEGTEWIHLVVHKLKSTLAEPSSTST